jgi:hypothetical protein
MFPESLLPNAALTMLCSRLALRCFDATSFEIPPGKFFLDAS